MMMMFLSYVVVVVALVQKRPPWSATSAERVAAPNSVVVDVDIDDAVGMVSIENERLILGVHVVVGPEKEEEEDVQQRRTKIIPWIPTVVVAAAAGVGACPEHGAEVVPSVKSSRDAVVVVAALRLLPQQ